MTKIILFFQGLEEGDNLGCGDVAKIVNVQHCT